MTATGNTQYGPQGSLFLPPQRSSDAARIGFSLLRFPFELLIASLYYVVRYFGAYSQGVAAALGVGGHSEIRRLDYPPEKRTGRREPAYVHFLFGPVWLDLRQVIVVGLRRQLDFTKAEFTRVKDRYFVPDTANADSRTNPVTGSARIVAMFTGYTVVVVLLVAVLLVQAVIVAALWCIGLSLIYMLRGLDSMLLHIRSIRVTCDTPGCFHRVAYPSYKCPGDGTMHGDVRPGRYGVLRRRCRCGRAFPTLLMLGSYELEAFCPRCGSPLAAGSGRHRQIVVPVFGLPGAGKTQLLAAMATVLPEVLERHDGEAQPLDDYTRRWMQDAASRLTSAEGPLKTPNVAQRPYGLQLSGRGGTRLLKMFDAAGETFSNPQRVRELRYLEAGGVVCFVIDPLSIPEFQALLPTSQRLPDHADRPGPTLTRVLGEIVQNMHRMRIDISSIQLYVAISKADLIEQQIVAAGLGDSDSIREWFTGPPQQRQLGQANLHAIMAKEFRSVRFFLTRAVQQRSNIDPSVETFVTELLAAEGYEL